MVTQTITAILSLSLSSNPWVCSRQKSCSLVFYGADNYDMERYKVFTQHTVPTLYKPVVIFFLLLITSVVYYLLCFRPDKHADCHGDQGQGGGGDVDDQKATEEKFKF